MGHESGTKNHAGAQGLRRPRQAEIVTGEEAQIERRISDDDIMRTLEQNELNQAQIIARGLVPRAFGTLKQVMIDRKLPAGPRVSASKEILDRAYGKTSPNRIPRQADAGGGGLKVVVLNLSSNTEREVSVNVSEEREELPEAEKRIASETPPGVSILEIER